MINIVCWKWKRKGRRHPAHKKEFNAHHVNVLYAMLERNLTKPFTLTCVTDNWNDIRKEVRIVPLCLWGFYNKWVETPGCYLRLYAFSEDMSMFFDSPFISIDLDVVIVNNITKLVSNIGQFKIWGRVNIGAPYCGAMWGMKIGSRSFVWDTFPGKKYIDRQALRRKTKKKNQNTYAPDNAFGGTDQSWINMCLYPREKSWTKQVDGIYDYKLDILKPDLPLPENARIIFFNGQHDPSQNRCLSIGWINKYWRL